VKQDVRGQNDKKQAGLRRLFRYVLTAGVMFSQQGKQTRRGQKILRGTASKKFVNQATKGNFLIEIVHMRKSFVFNK
jgi:hypothetical protein